MLHAGGFTTLILALLDGMIDLDSDCLTGERMSNISTEIPKGEYCSEVMNHTAQYCHCCYVTMSNTHSIIETARNNSISFANTENLQDLERAVQMVKEVLSIPAEIFASIRNCTNTQHSCLSQYEEEKGREKNYTDTYKLLLTYLDAARTTQNIVWYYVPPILTIFFICGMIGNGLLLLIFFKHPETRSGPKVLLINLAVSDILLLLLNFFAKYYFKLRPFTLGETACRIYIFLVLVPPRVSILSIMVLCIIRYIAVTAMPGDRSYKLLNYMYITVVLVWVAACLEALQPALDSVLTDCKSLGKTHCGICITMTTGIVMAIVTCFVPFVVIGFFTWGTYQRLREGAQERAGKTELDLAKERNVKILPVLTVLFVITYPPLYVFRFVTTIHKFTLSSTLVWFYYLTQFLLTINSALNPVVLYLSSGMFREYFKKYLRFGCGGKQQQQQQAESSSGQTANTPC